MATVTALGNPLPQLSDSPNVPGDFQSLTLSMEKMLGGPTFTTTAARDAAITSPVNGQKCWVGTLQYTYITTPSAGWVPVGPVLLAAGAFNSGSTSGGPATIGSSGNLVLPPGNRFIRVTVGLSLLTDIPPTDARAYVTGMPASGATADGMTWMSALLNQTGNAFGRTSIGKSWEFSHSGTVKYTLMLYKERGPGNLYIDPSAYLTVTDLGPYSGV